MVEYELEGWGVEVLGSRGLRCGSSPKGSGVRQGRRAAKAGAAGKEAAAAQAELARMQVRPMLVFFSKKHVTWGR